MPEPIADEGTGLAALLEWNDPIAIAFYSDLSQPAGFIAMATTLAAPRPVRELTRAEDAIPLAGEQVLIIMQASDEAAAVAFLDRNRDHFDGDGARVILLLLRGGSGEKALADAFGLASFARSGSFDLDTPGADPAGAFQQAHGMDSAEWLRRWRAGSMADTLANNLVLSEALSIEVSA